MRKDIANINICAIFAHVKQKQISIIKKEHYGN